MRATAPGRRGLVRRFVVLGVILAGLLVVIVLVSASGDDVAVGLWLALAAVGVVFGIAAWALFAAPIMLERLDYFDRPPTIPREGKRE